MEELTNSHDSNKRKSYFDVVCRKCNKKITDELKFAAITTRLRIEIENTMHFWRTIVIFIKISREGKRASLSMACEPHVVRFRFFF